ncbi:MAG: 1-acyl-sn-glycerol-3-phosphate acyltransferase [Bacteroidales bacterium]|nr:1-acyl-sn-glycerol-3-phosphate acyltransferase [Bacteroidales bacterium]
MEKNPEFDDIRPFYDDEVIPVIKKLLADPQFKEVIYRVFSPEDWIKFEAVMLNIKSKKDFQHGVIKVGLDEVIGKTIDSMVCTGFENVSKKEAYTYISNHRDIVLDAALLAIMLDNEGYETMEIAIGDNLLLYPWIENVVRLNKSFIVKRGINVRQMMEVSTHLSKYIHFAVRDKNESVWIAQREGRAKDSNDKTQESVLKMLSIGGEHNFIENIEELNITPVSLSYEYDPCDYLKAKEFQQKRDNPEFKKSKADDMLNMQTGIFGYKGNVHFQIGKPINPSVKSLELNQSKNELIGKIASLIDREIYLNYRFYPGNYIAYDYLWGNGKFSNHYSMKNKDTFDTYINQQLEKIKLENKDVPYLREKMLEMYAYPVKNHLAVTEQ